FPKPVKLGPRIVAWVGAEVEEWILERIEDRDEGLA
ncbi:AlpA family phage regulatory protein, partial [Shewanella algae]